MYYNKITAITKRIKRRICEYEKKVGCFAYVFFISFYDSM